jgi:DNA polymerase IV
MVIPVDAVKSIDEMTCKLDVNQRKCPEDVGRLIKARLHDLVGPWIKCSLGYAANRHLAKMACKAGKPNGNRVWHPKDMPTPLLDIPIKDVPGIGASMLKRLWKAQIWDMEALLKTQPKQLRAIWHNVTGERLWYALHGYNIQAEPTEKGMYGHGRVLPPSHRGLERVRPFSRMLLTKAARRLRRDGYSASSLHLWLGGFEQSWSFAAHMPALCDDVGILQSHERLWQRVYAEIKAHETIVRVGVTLGELSRTEHRQLDLLIDDEPKRRKLEAVTHAIDGLNRRYGRTLVSVGPWTPPPGDHIGGKISFTRIPRAEDFY